MSLSKRIAGDMDANLVESIISLFNSGVLVHYVKSPRSSFNPDNCKLTINAANGVRFEGREKLISFEKEIEKLKGLNMIKDDQRRNNDRQIEKLKAENLLYKESNDFYANKNS